VPRNFSSLVFLRQTATLVTVDMPRKYVDFFSEYSLVIQSFQCFAIVTDTGKVCFAGIVGTSNELFTGANDTGK
jgi:hypothetical protein